MPAKRRATELSTPKPRLSKLAKEHNITNEEENEIREAFALFAEPMKGEKEVVIPIGDVRRAMIALSIPPTGPELTEFLSILDPESEGFAVYPSFLGICALKFHSRTRTSDSQAEEVEEAFRLFTKGQREGDRITMDSLKRVARILKEDVDEAVLKDMILEANGGAGVGRGVEKEEFEEVMRRAGVFR